MSIDIFSLGGFLMLTTMALFGFAVLAATGRRLARIEKYLAKTYAETDVRWLTNEARERLAARYRRQFGGSR